MSCVFWQVLFIEGHLTKEMAYTCICSPWGIWRKRWNAQKNHSLLSEVWWGPPQRSEVTTRGFSGPDVACDQLNCGTDIVGGDTGVSIDLECGILWSIVLVACDWQIELSHKQRLYSALECIFIWNYYNSCHRVMVCVWHNHSTDKSVSC